MFPADGRRVSASARTMCLALQKSWRSMLALIGQITEDTFPEGVCQRHRMVVCPSKEPRAAPASCRSRALLFFR